MLELAGEGYFKKMLELTDVWHFKKNARTGRWMIFKKMLELST
jgi:hypothetical protein